jgi:hypothetical protein
MYAPRVKMAAAFPSSGSGQDWTDFPSRSLRTGFEHSLSLMMTVYQRRFIGNRCELFNSPYILSVAGIPKVTVRFSTLHLIHCPFYTFIRIEKRELLRYRKAG